MKHYLQVTDKHFSEAAGVTQGVAHARGNRFLTQHLPVCVFGNLHSGV